MNKYFLHINEPCSQDWDSMTAAGQGKFCSQCSKTVIDFTGLSDAEIVRYIESKKDFTGVITEKVPVDFEILPPENSTPYDSIAVFGNTKIISWNVDLSAGEKITLGYYFDAPNISPEIFFIGPLDFIQDDNTKIFSENRQWQIASDAACT